MTLTNSSRDVAQTIRDIEMRANRTYFLYQSKLVSNRTIAFNFIRTVLIVAMFGWMTDLAVPEIAPLPLAAMSVAGVISASINVWHARVSNKALRAAAEGQI
jgi:F0F1-type ATP synthase assembly protein I